MFKKLVLSVSLAAALIVNIAGSAVNAFAVDNSYVSQCERALELVNNYRTENGVDPLILYVPACSAAQERAEEIETSFSHDRPDGSAFYTVWNNYNVSIKSCGENIAFGFYDADEVIEAWMNSEGHRKNILNPEYKYLGIGIYEGGWVQEFCSTFESSSYTLGDVNNDGLINAVDASQVLEFYACSAVSSAFEQTEQFKNAADVDKNGQIDSVDASKILEYYAESSTGVKASF